MFSDLETYLLKDNFTIEEIIELSHDYAALFKTFHDITKNYAR